MLLRTNKPASRKNNLSLPSGPRTITSNAYLRNIDSRLVERITDRGHHRNSTIMGSSIIISLFTPCSYSRNPEYSLLSKERNPVRKKTTKYFIIPYVWENPDKTKVPGHVLRSECRTKSHINMDNSSFEMMEEFKYFGTTLVNQNYIQEEIKSRLKSGNACYHSMQNLLSSSLLSRNIKIKIYRTIIFACCFVWV